MRKGKKNGNREAALAYTTIYVNVDKVGQTPHKGMKIGHLSEGASLFAYYFFTTYIDSHLNYYLSGAICAVCVCLHLQKTLPVIQFR